MKLTFVFLITFLILLSDTKADNLNDKWLVILSGFDNIAEAIQSKNNYKFETIILNSNDYDNLNAGWFINCIAYNTKEEAKNESKRLLDKDFNNYIKYSGKFKSDNKYLLENHHIIFRGKYLITDHKIKFSNIDNIIGCDQFGDAFVPMVSVDKDSLPESLKYLVGKEMVVYDINNNKSTVKVIEFIAAGFNYPYWGRIMKWKQNNTSGIDIAKELLFIGKEIPLVAIIENQNDMNLGIAHIKADNEFSLGEQNMRPDIVYKAFVKLESLDIINECDSLLVASLKMCDSINRIPKKSENDYILEAHQNTYKNAKVLNVSDSTFVFINYFFGDYCDNERCMDHFNIFAIWNVDSDNIDIISEFKHMPPFKHIPMYITGKNDMIIGFLKWSPGGTETYFKYPDWKLTKKLNVKIAQGCN
jgi:hypothetical protein